MNEETPTITVRYVEDHRTGKCWFEEKLQNNQWVTVTSTVASCQGNARFNLEKEIERRRQQRLAIHRTSGNEETFAI